MLTHLLVGLLGEEISLSVEADHIGCVHEGETEVICGDDAV